MVFYVLNFKRQKLHKLLKQTFDFKMETKFQTTFKTTLQLNKKETTKVLKT
jgi:hypothetical protein